MAYARIEEGFWTDPKIKALPLEGKMLAAWLFTNPHRHFSGLYYLPMVLISYEIGLSIGVSERMVNLLKDQGFMRYDHEFSVVWVVTMLRHQAGGGKLSKQQITGITNHLATLHGCPLIAKFVEQYKGLGVKYGGKIDTPNDTPINTPTDTPTDIKSQSQSQSQSKLKDLPDSKSGDSLPKLNGRDFENELKTQFYPAYPKKKDPAGALKAYIKQGKAGILPTIEALLTTIEDQKTWPEWNREGGKYIPYPGSWLNGERWKDERSGPPLTARRDYATNPNRETLVND